jgi:hypothetical protein
MARINFDDLSKVTGVEFIERPIKGSLQSGAVVENSMFIPVPGTSSTVVAALLEMTLTDTRRPVNELRVMVGEKVLDSLNGSVEPDINPQDWLLSVIQNIIAKAQSKHQEASVR